MAKYNLEVELSGVDGNAFCLIGTVARVLKQAGAKKEELDEFRKEALSGDYDNVLQTCMKWVNVT